MTGTALKFLMAFLMFFDHIGHFVSPDLQAIFHVITRCVGVFFGYMAVEGFYYTRNRKAYLGRLFGMAAFMFAGNTLINLAVNRPGVELYNNIFLTLGLGISLLWLVSLVNQRNSLVKNGLLILTSLFILVSAPVISEGGMVIVPFMLLTYLFRDKPVLRNGAYLIFAGILFASAYTPYPTIPETLRMLAYNSDFLFITVLPFIYLYNGKRGKSTLFNKYFFYFFYPAHLWLIGLAAIYL